MNPSPWECLREYIWDFGYSSSLRLLPSLFILLPYWVFMSSTVPDLSSTSLNPHHATPPPFSASLFLSKVCIWLISGHSAKFGLFVSHNCIQSLCYIFEISVSNGICLLCNIGVFLEFCGILKYECKPDLYKIFIKNEHPNCSESILNILKLGFTALSLCIMQLK